MNYLYSDGGARGNPGPSAIGYFLFDENNLLDFGGEYLGDGTNNQAEYSALLSGLALAKKYNIQELTCKLDSELVVKQLKGEYKVKDENIRVKYDLIISQLKNFKAVQFVHVPRAENKLADRMVNIILDANAKT